MREVKLRKNSVLTPGGNNAYISVCEVTAILVVEDLIPLNECASMKGKILAHLQDIIQDSIRWFFD